MISSKVASRLNAQPTKFSLELSEELPCLTRKFVQQIFYGLQASQDVKVSSIAGSLQEKIPLIKTAKTVYRATWRRRSWRFIWGSGWRAGAAGGCDTTRCCRPT